jgi:hypothetical protein
MAILKNNSKRTEHKLVGASLPLPVHSYLTIYTLAKGLSKTKIIKPIIEEWVDKHKQKETEIQLIKEIINRYQLQWKLIKSSHPMNNLIEFKKCVEHELKEKGLLINDINLILKGIN